MVDTEQARAHLWVSGRVQGVFFRQETARQAREKGLSGWVGNLGDGRVEAVFEGSPEAVGSIIDWCRTGPGLARVEQVEVIWEPVRGEEGFRIAH